MRLCTRATGDMSGFLQESCDLQILSFLLLFFFLSFALLLSFPIIRLRRKKMHEIEEYEREERIIKCKKIKHVEIEFWKQNDTSFKEEWNPNKIVKSSICEHTS